MSVPFSWKQVDLDDPTIISSPAWPDRSQNLSWGTQKWSPIQEMINHLMIQICEVRYRDWIRWKVSASVDIEKRKDKLDTDSMRNQLDQLRSLQRLFCFKFRKMLVDFLRLPSKKVIRMIFKNLSESESDQFLQCLSEEVKEKILKLLCVQEPESQSDEAQPKTKRTRVRKKVKGKLKSISCKDKDKKQKEQISFPLSLQWKIKQALLRCIPCCPWNFPVPLCCPNFCLIRTFLPGKSNLEFRFEKFSNAFAWRLTPIYSEIPNVILQSPQPPEVVFEFPLCRVDVEGISEEGILKEGKKIQTSFHIWLEDILISGGISAGSEMEVNPLSSDPENDLGGKGVREERGEKDVPRKPIQKWSLSPEPRKPRFARTLRYEWSLFPSIKGKKMTVTKVELSVVHPETETRGRSVAVVEE